MTVPTENENWLIDQGDLIIKKKASEGAAALSSWERLVYCLWVADYGMTNAGDLAPAEQLHGNFKPEALQIAQSLDLSSASRLFSLENSAFESSYFALFESVCFELRSAGGSA